jgi:tetratricopeptide (TPR) repeat protein
MKSLLNNTALSLGLAATLLTTALLPTAAIAQPTPSIAPSTQTQVTPPLLLAQAMPNAAIDNTRVSLKGILYKDAARVYVKNRQPAKAKAALEKALLFANDAGTFSKCGLLTEIADIYVSLQDFAKAEQILDQVIREGATVTEFNLG